MFLNQGNHDVNDDDRIRDKKQKRRAVTSASPSAARGMKCWKDVDSA